jgi:hypothetical protein
MKRILLKIYCKFYLLILGIRIQIVSSDLEFLESQELDATHKKEKLSYLFKEKYKFEFILSMI